MGSELWQAGSLILIAACGLFRLWNGMLSCSVWDPVPDQGWNPGPLHWEHRVLTPRPPGKSHHKANPLSSSRTLPRHHILQEAFLELPSVSSLQFGRSVVSDSLQPQGPQHTRPTCPSPTPGVYSNSCPLSRWCHPTISSSVIPFPSCPQSLPASGSFQMSQLFASGGQNIGVSASTSVLPMSNQERFLKPPLCSYLHSYSTLYLSLDGGYTPIFTTLH